MKVTQIKARRIFDSRGLPTVEADIIIDGQYHGRAAVPSGASTGSKEALELRDGGKAFHGKDVMKAVQAVNTNIAQKIAGQEFNSQSDFDRMLIELDGTENKSNLGANAILAASLAFSKATASKFGKIYYELFSGAYSMPVPFMNVINGGAHADNGLDIQEFMIVPHGFENFVDRMRAGSEIFHTLKAKLKKAKLSVNVGDEGGFAPNLNKSSDALELISQSVLDSGYKLGEQVSLALDVAASEFYENGKYKMHGENLECDSHGMVHYLAKLCEDFPIISIEDPMHESDYGGWQAITASLGKSRQIVGDDVFVTNPKLIQMGVEKNMANAALIKLNQIGTLTETIDAIRLAQSAGWKCMISHRSGETEDTAIAHIAVGLGLGQIKTGSLSRTDRMCKYNELLRIEELLASK